MKYKQNLKVEGSKVYSYDIHVATIDSTARKLYVHGYWSMTTSKHINHVADVFGLIKEDRARGAEEVKQEQKRAGDSLRSVGLVALLGDVFHAGDVKAQNDWKARMLKAGLESKGLIMPDDWDSLEESEKARRLDGAIGEITKI
jgi:hypothetical protein